MCIIYASSTTLHILLTMYNTPCIINMLWTVRFPFIVIHMMLAIYNKAWMACQSYFIGRSLHITYTCRLPPSVELTEACPNKAKGKCRYLQTLYIKHIHFLCSLEINKVSIERLPYVVWILKVSSRSLNSLGSYRALFNSV